MVRSERQIPHQNFQKRSGVFRDRIESQGTGELAIPVTDRKLPLMFGTDELEGFVELHWRRQSPHRKWSGMVFTHDRFSVSENPAEG